jgi:hypothetical protein
MIDFAVISGERSASTWTANWLTTDDTICYHDPMLRWTLDELSHLKVPGKRVGISCTAQGHFPEWINRQLCPVIVLHREHAEIEASWSKIGVQPFQSKPDLTLVAGSHWTWASVFSPEVAKAMWEYLIPGKPFDLGRHHELVNMHVQPYFLGLDLSATGVTELGQRIRGLLGTT